MSFTGYQTFNSAPATTMGGGAAAGGGFTGYGNPGGASSHATGGGGGFMEMSDATSPSTGKTKRSGAQTKSLTPVTIRQLQTAQSGASDDSSFTVDDRVLGQVTFVALIRQRVEQTAFLNLNVDDGTSLIDVRYWCDKTSEDPSKTAEREAWTEGAYIRVVGHLRTFQGRRNVHAHFVRVLDDMNELTYHLAETIMVHKRNTSAPKALNPSAGYGAAFTSAPAPVGAAYAAPTGASAPGVSGNFPPVQAEVINFVVRSSASSDSGPHISEMISALASRFGDAEVRGAVQALTDEGHLYSTVDEEHFKYAASS